jgi:cytosine/uracil/thiamine/allantoin permease
LAVVSGIGGFIGALIGALLACHFCMRHHYS